MFGFSLSEALIIMIVALFAVGPKRMPGLAKAIGRAINEFRNAMTDVRSSVLNEVRQPFDEMKKPLNELKNPLQEAQRPLKESSSEYIDKLLAERAKNTPPVAPEASPYPEENALKAQDAEKPEADKPADAPADKKQTP